MPKMIFVNLPVADLAASIRFYTALGATQNMQFSDERTACMLLSETIGVMLLTHERFGEFVSRPIGNARTESQSLLALTAESRAEVDGTVLAAGAAGGRADPTPSQDHGFMYYRTVEDPDGYIWELVWMNMEAPPEN